MREEQWQAIDELLDQALDLAPAERARFLDEACANVPDLRAKVGSLLVASEQAGNFLEEPLPGSIFEPQDPDPLMGQRVGPYRLLREIGRGGMGVVYLADRADGEFDKLVAVKLIHPGPRNDALLARFRRERQILANLDHPSIARLIDGRRTEDGAPYIVMEYVAGTPITDYCDQRRLSISDRLELFIKVCEAVQYAHQNLIIHRDLKPSNILVTPDGAIKLLDFGVAKLLDSGASSATVSVTTGYPLTPEYASPEHVLGRPATTASDVYSLGVVLYELVTGHRPYRFKDRSLPEMVRVISEEEPESLGRAINRVETADEGGAACHEIPSPATVSRTREGSPDKLRARLRGDLNEITLTALRKDPLKRYGTVDQLSDDIRRHLDRRPVRARKGTVVYRGTKFIRRYKTGVVVATLILLTLLGGIVATTRQASIARREARDKHRSLYAAEMNLAAQAWEAANIARYRQILDRWIPHGGEEDLRAFEWYYLRRLRDDGGELSTLPHDVEVWSVAFSPDGKTLATGDNNGSVNLWDPATGARLNELPGDGGCVWGLAFSPDSGMLAATNHDFSIRLLESRTLSEIASLRGHNAKVRDVEFSPDGRRLASVAWNGVAIIWDTFNRQELIRIDTGSSIWALAFAPDGATLALGTVPMTVWDARTGLRVRCLKRCEGNASCRFSPDGRRLASGAANGSVNIVDVRSGAEIVRFSGHTSRVHSIAFSPDGKLLATGSKDRTARIWDATSGQCLQTIRGHEGEIFSLDFSSDGAVLATSGDDFTTRLWDVASRPAPVNPETMSSVPLALSANGQRFATATRDSVVIREAQSERKLAEVAAIQPGIKVLALSPDGSRLAIGYRDGVVTRWDIASGTKTASQQAHSSQVSSMMFSADGELLATASWDGTVKLWDAVTLRQIRSFSGDGGLISSVAFSPNGEKLACAGYDRLARLWRARTDSGEPTVLRGHTEPILSLAFSPDGTAVATGGADSTVRLWDALTGVLRLTFKGLAGHVKALAFSPDGSRLAIGSDEGSVRLWDVETGREVIALTGHNDSVISLAFSPDGGTLFSSSQNGTVRIWRTASRTAAFTQAALTRKDPVCSGVVGLGAIEK